jgi:hypothetical protein
MALRATFRTHVDFESNQSSLLTDSEWLAGHLNGTADLLSRPGLTISPTAFCTQIYQSKPELISWHFFLPSPDFVLLLEHLLCSNAWQGKLGLPDSFRQYKASHWLHHFLFCHAVGLAENPLLENVPQQRCNAQMALYAVHLASGDTLYCHAIRAATIGAYLRGDVAQSAQIRRNTAPNCARNPIRCAG